MLLAFDIRTRDGLGRTLMTSRAFPLTHVACIDRSAMLVGSYRASTTSGPGWLTLLSGERDLDALQRRPFLERPGLGLHHLAARWPLRNAGASEALARLLSEPLIGPTLAEAARHLGWNATSLGRAILRESGLPYPTIRIRRGLMLMAGLIACEGRNFTAAAASIGWDLVVATRTFRANGIDWHRFARPGGRARIVTELSWPLLSSPFVSKRDRSVAADD